MADTKISDLPTVVSVDGSEYIPVVKLGSTQKATPLQVKNYLNLSGTNTGDQDLSGLALKSTTVNGHPLSANVTVTASDVGLGNAENTSDANKPISTATATALAGKQATLVSGTNIKTINGNNLLGSGDLVLAGAGTVTSASVVSANGFAGSVATATTTPAITLSTSVTGLLKGNGTAISAAVAGTDIKTINSASLIGSGDIAVGTVTTASVASANGFAGSVATASTTPVITLSTSLTGLLKGNGTAMSVAVSGTDIKTVNGISLIGSGDVVVSGSGGRTAPNFANSSTQVAQRSNSTINLSTSRQIGQVDNVVIWASGGSVSAGTLTQVTTAISGSTGYAARAAGVTLTGSGVISHSIQMEARDAVKYKNQTVSFSVKVDHDVGSSIHYTLVVKKPTVADTFGTQSTIATSGTTLVSTATATTLTFDAVSVGDCSNGLVLEVQAACGAVTTKNFNCTEFSADVAATAQTYVAPEIAAETAKSQRYYYRVIPVAGEILGHGSASSTTNAAALIHFPVKMRIAPTAVQQSGTPTDYNTIQGVTSRLCSTVPTFSVAGTTNCRVIFPVSSGLTASQIIEIQAETTGGYLGFTGAELI